MFAVATKTLFFSAIISIRCTTISSACGGVNSTFLLQDIVTLMEKITQHTATVVKRSKTDIFKDICHVGEVPNQLHDFAIVANIPGL